MTQRLTQEECDIIVEDARYGDLESLQEIFSEVASSLLRGIRESETLNTPIHMSSANGHLEVVRYLLGLLSNEDAIKLVNAVNYEGNTALHWASLNGHLEVVKLLCETYGADAFLKNKFGHDSIFEAENNGQEETETYFLQKYDVEPLGDEVDIKVSNAQVEVNQGEEIDKITQEQVDELESNEKFLEERAVQNLGV